MELNNLTVLIPSIGRESIKNAINSIPKECKIIISFDNPIDTIFSDGNEHYINNFKSAGRNKQFLIDKVETPYFIMLDDDDEFVPGILELMLRDLKNTSMKWASVHYTSKRNLLWRENILFAPTIIYNKEKFSSHYFNWTDDPNKYKDNQLNWIYPNSEVMVETNAFLNMQKTNPETLLTEPYYDEAVAMTNFMAYHPGMNYDIYGIYYRVPENSVSHTSKRLPDENNVLDRVVSRMIRRYHETGDWFWMRAIYNLIGSANYNYKHY